MSNSRPEIKRYKKGLEYSYTYGVFPTLELLKKTPKIVNFVLISPFGSENAGIDEIVSLCEKKDIKIIRSQKLILKLAKKENTYAIAQFSKYERRLNPQENHIVLVNPSDAGNLGTIIRTMTGLNYRNLAVIRPAVDIFDPRAIRSTMGSLFHINFQHFETFDEYLKTFAKHNLYMFMIQDSEDIENVNFKKPYALIFGSEGSGLPKEIGKLGKRVRITQSSNIDSYNLAISCSLAMYIAKRKGH